MYGSFVTGSDGDSLIFPAYFFHCIKPDCIDKLKLDKDVIWYNNNNNNTSIYCQLVYIAGKEHSNEEQNLNLLFRWQYIQDGFSFAYWEWHPSYYVRQHKQYIWYYIQRQQWLAYKIDILSHDCILIILC